MVRLLLMAFTAISISAAPASGLLESMQEKIALMGSVRISVSIQDMDASVITDGTRYSMDSDVMKVWCDGHNQWIYNPDRKEITLTQADVESVDIFENPASVLTSKILDAYAVVSEQNGSVVLKARKNVKVSYPQITIKVGSDTLPQTVTLKSASGDTYDMKIVSIRTVPAQNDSAFRPSEDLLNKSFLNDMR